MALLCDIFIKAFQIFASERCAAAARFLSTCACDSGFSLMLSWRYAQCVPLDVRPVPYWLMVSHGEHTQLLIFLGRGATYISGVTGWHHV